MCPPQVYIYTYISIVFLVTLNIHNCIYFAYVLTSPESDVTSLHLCPIYTHPILHLSLFHVSYLEPIFSVIPITHYVLFT